MKTRVIAASFAAYFDLVNLAENRGAIAASA
jgi:hypothetical protein